MKFVGIDIGTTSICGMVLDAVNGKIETMNRPNDSWVFSRNKWERKQYPERILAIVGSILDVLLRKHRKIAGIGVTGQMHGILYINANGEAVSPLYTWQDARGSLPYKRTGKTYSQMISERTGYTLAPGLGMVTHWYNRENGLVPAPAVKVCTIHDYYVMGLTGSTLPAIDPTDAASLGIFNLIKNTFDIKALSRAGIGPEEIPEVLPSGTLVGSYRGIPVCTALGDNQASFLGAVRNIKKTVLLNIGTGGQISAFSPNYEQVNGLDVRPFPGGGYIMVGALLCGGKAYALLENFFRKTADFFSLPAGNKDFYMRMNKINYADIREKLDVDTRFAGTRQNSSVRGEIKSISMNNFLPECMVAGFLDGIAKELHDFYSIMPESLRGRVSMFTGSGNGIRRNNLLRSIIGMRFGKKITLPLHSEEASFGAALTAAVATGFFSDFHKAGRIVKYARE